MLCKLIAISGTQEVVADLDNTSTASLAVYIRYAHIGDCQCHVAYAPCVLTVCLTHGGNSYRQYIVTNCDTALYTHLALGTYKITVQIDGYTYCTSYTLHGNSRIMLHALPQHKLSHHANNMCTSCLPCIQCCDSML